MDYELFEQVYQETPKFNPRIAGNICVEMMNNVEQTIVDTFLSSQHDYPPSLRFVGLERVDPKTQFIHGGWVKDEFDITKNTIYMVRLKFEFDGKPLKDYYLYLPYCYSGGIMVIGGATFALNPVLIDPCLSVTDNSIFISANKDKITFRALPWHYFENNRRRNEYIVYSSMYRGGAKPTGSTFRGHKTRNMKSVLAHYLFTQYGLSGTFKKYLGIDSVVVGYDDIDEINYPPDTWTICTSIGEKPAKSFLSKNYFAPRVSLAIKNEHLTHDSRSLIASFFYIADHFPESFGKELEEDFDSATFYRKLLSIVILPFQQDKLVAYRDMERHLESLKTYIDENIRRKLQQIENINAGNIYDLFADMIFTYQNRITQTVDQLTTMYNKRLVLLPYLLEDIIQSIYKLSFELQSAKNDPLFTAQKAEKKITKFIRPLAIISINKRHREVAPIQVATDNLIVKISSPVIPQSKMGKVAQKKVVITLPMVLSASIAEVGNITSTAGDSTGRSRLNMFLLVDNEGYILRNPELVDLIDNAQREIAR